MKLLFVGCGSAFTVGDGNYQSNMMFISDSNEHLLIDCGGDARLALYELGFNHRDIHEVYISHLHGDHIGGLEWLGFATKYDPNCSRPVLHISPDLCDDLWNTSLYGGLSSCEDPNVSLTTYFDVQKIENNSFQWKNYTFNTFRVFHVKRGSYNLPCYGLWSVVDHGKTIMITADTKFMPDYMQPYYEKADIIFHDCETKFKTGVHAHYDELMTLDPVLRSKMWLYHCQPFSTQDPVKDGFRGFVKRGQIFDFSNPEIY